MHIALLVPPFWPPSNELSMHVTAKDVKAVQNGRHKKGAGFIGGIIAPSQPYLKRHKMKARGTDLPNEVERAVQVLGKFGEVVVNSKWDTSNVERTDRATRKNVTQEVERNIGDGLRIFETTVGWLVAPRCSRSLVAKKHRPLAAVQHRKIHRTTLEGNIDGHFSCRRAKRAIERTTK